ncbi:hypothetical protein NUW54_g5697 [Trametes sanguinea]|uniref:Uncharacterized protein n=1 Tax=Trametes sanguinea TaxID=158606 RepID=A0ACC1PWX1_9APHY|nr:hypothetical protein NUW54_g5697 [Trametes sanguinea]
MTQPDEHDDDADDEKLDMPGAFPSGPSEPEPEPTTLPGMVHILPHGRGGGHNAFRIGFAGRGMNRGRGL